MDCKGASILFVLFVTWLPLSSCGRSADSPSAAACAKVVQQVRGLPGPVKVTDAVETAEGQVEIAYQALDRASHPVTGSASCSFAVGGQGPLQLIEAVVDEAPLDEDELAAANHALSESRP